jgi:hypothetical protein
VKFAERNFNAVKNIYQSIIYLSADFLIRMELQGKLPYRQFADLDNFNFMKQAVFWQGRVFKNQH